MSYCVNCGVELANHERCCPLCDTEVINPKVPFDENTEKPFPIYTPTIKSKAEPKSVLAILGIIFALPTSLCLIADILIYKDITWSGFVLIGFASIFSLIASSLILRSFSPFAEELFDGAVLSACSMYVNYRTEGDWFLTLALPLIGYFVLFMIIFTLMTKIFRTTILSKLGGCCYLTALFCVLADMLITVNFGVGRYLIGWSLFPLVSFGIIGTAFLFIDKNIPLKRKLAKMFFI